MDGINKIVSFVLGLIVVAIFLVIISGRLQIGKKFFTASRGSATTSTPTKNNVNDDVKSTGAVTPSPAVKTTAKPTSRVVAQNKTPNPTKSVGRVESIPNTGPDSLMAILAVSAAITGYGLWKMSEV